jgi:hypothetical protein
MGHNTPTNVLAWAGEQAKEQHNAIAVASFFTPHLPLIGFCQRGMRAVVDGDSPAAVENL